MKNDKIAKGTLPTTIVGLKGPVKAVDIHTIKIKIKVTCEENLNAVYVNINHHKTTTNNSENTPEITIV